MRLLNVFLLSPLKKRGDRAQKTAEKIRHLGRDAFVDDPILSVFMTNKKKSHHK